MTNDFSVKKNKDSAEFNTQLNSETFTYQEKGGEKFNLGIFDLLKKSTDFDLLKNKVDINNDGTIDETELADFKEKFIKTAGDDKILQKNEILKLFGLECDSEESIMLDGQMQALIQSSKGGTVKEYSDKYNTKIIKNPDNSGVDFFRKGVFNGIGIYGTNGKRKEEFNVSNCDLLTLESYNVSVTNHIKYSQDGKILEHTFVYPGEKVSIHGISGLEKNPFIKKSNFEYFPDGEKKSEKIEKTDKKTGKKTIDIKHFNENGDVIFNSSEHWTIVNGKMSHRMNNKTTEYDSDGNKTKEIIFIEDENGDKTNSEMHYKNNKLTEKHSRKEKGSNVIVDDYYGENLENRDTKLPSTRIIYAKDGITIKSKTENEFDKDGILLTQTVYTPNSKGKLKKKVYDVSGLNRKYELNVSQGGVGNCYLMQSMISMGLTKSGHKLLQKIITPETTVDAKGNVTTIYHAHLAGVEQAKQYLIDNFGQISNGKKTELNPDDILIKSDYVITSDEFRQAQYAAGKHYSFGDKEYLLPEIAYVKFRRDSEQTFFKNELSLLGNEYISGLDHGRGTDVISGGQSFISMYILSGKKSDIYFNPSEKVNICTIDEDGNIHLSDKEQYSVARTNFTRNSDAIADRYLDFNEYYDTIKNDLDRHGTLKNHALFASIYVSTQEVNGQPVQDGAHALVVKGFKDDKALLINPWDGTKDLKMSIADFKKAIIMFGGIDCR